MRYQKRSNRKRCVLLGRYVHDSLAGFCLAGPITHDDKAQMLVDIVHRQGKGEHLNAYEQQVFENYQKRVSAEKAGAVEVPQGQTGVEQLVRDRVEKKKLMHATNRKDQLEQEAAYQNDARFEYKDAQYVDDCNLFPVMRDADSAQLQSWVNARATGVITSGRREGGGYFLPRAVFE